VLYALCRRYPEHSDRRSLTAKIALIGRAYSAGLERRVTPPDGLQAITVIADYCEKNARKLDEIVARLQPVKDPLSLQSIAEIVAVHGDLAGLLSGVTKGRKTPRSFASKYLHFHNPAVPIYDSYALAGIIKLVRWDSSSIPFECPPGGDAAPDGYYHFCVRFWRLYDACRQAGLHVTVKALDMYLWAVPTRSPDA
jgi:hypothetical protein